MLTKSQQKLVEDNQRFAFFMVNQFLRRNSMFDHLYNDLVQGAYLGLIYAAKSFKVGKANFTTYSKGPIKWYMCKELNVFRKAFDCTPIDNFDPDSDHYSINVKEKPLQDNNSFDPEHIYSVKEQIAKKYGIDKFQALCNSPLRSNKPKSKNMVLAIQKMHSSGLTYVQIQQKTGVCYKTLKKVLQTKTRAKRTFSKELIQSIKTDRISGATWQELSRKFGINQGTLSRVFKREINGQNSDPDFVFEKNRFRV